MRTGTDRSVPVSQKLRPADGHVVSPQKSAFCRVAYHITQCDFDRQSVFLSRPDRDNYLSLIADNLKRPE